MEGDQSPNLKFKLDNLDYIQKKICTIRQTTYGGLIDQRRFIYYPKKLMEVFFLWIKGQLDDVIRVHISEAISNCILRE